MSPRFEEPRNKLGNVMRRSHAKTRGFKCCLGEKYLVVSFFVVQISLDEILHNISIVIVIGKGSCQFPYFLGKGKHFTFSFFFLEIVSSKK